MPELKMLFRRGLLILASLGLGHAKIFPFRSTRICPEEESGPDPTSYSMCLDLNIDREDEPLFTQAADTWTSKILGDLENISFRPWQRSPCGFFPSTVDDLHLCGYYEHIDGPKGVLGSARPQYYRTSDGLPVTGVMRFDTADISYLRSSGLLKDVIEHEMGHILGIGTLWSTLGVTGPSSADCPYYGIHANQEWQALTGCSQDAVVPTELDGGSGTRCGHWDEDCLVNEIMTGYLGNSLGQFSRLTIATLDDMGYVVPTNYSEVADPFGAQDVNPSCLCQGNDRRRLGGGTSSHSSGRDLRRKKQQQQKRPRLSEEGRRAAIEFGRQQLLEAKEMMMEGGTNATETEDSDMVFIGHLITNVLYLENDIVHEVEVTWED